MKASGGEKKTSSGSQKASSDQPREATPQSRIGSTQSQDEPPKTKKRKEVPLTISEPNLSVPKKKSKPPVVGKGKEKVYEAARSGKRAAAEFAMPFPPKGIWAGLPFEPIEAQDSEVIHSSTQFCPFKNVHINDRAGFAYPARQIMQNCILPRDDAVLSQLTDDQIWDGSCMAQLAVGLPPLSFFFMHIHSLMNVLTKSLLFDRQ